MATRQSSAVRPDRFNVILKAMARELWKEYGARAYQVFVAANPGGRIPSIERAILRRMGM